MPLVSALMKPLRCIVVTVLALSLTVGTGWQSCSSLQPKLTEAFIADAASFHSAMDHHDHMASMGHADVQPNSSNQAQHDDGHACLKCCATCMIGSIAILAPDSTIIRVASHLMLRPTDERLHGRVVFVDPDIPKSVT